MKIYYIILIACLMSFSLSAQLPQAFSFQGIAMDQNGDVLVDTDMTVTIVMLDWNSANVYEEDHEVTSTDLGHITLEIGRGTPVSGSFTTIDWSQGQLLYNVLLDPEKDGTSFSVGTFSMVSVPYAFAAMESASGLFGPSGPSGVPGNTGEQGPEGPPGPQGSTVSYVGNNIGPIGPVGPTGPQGIVGPQGAAGSNTGATGDPGPQGDQGLPGDPSNVAGPAGPQGPPGPEGAIGAVGPEGPAGPQGDGGGMPGPKGETGPVGPAKGDPGDPGYDGATGPQGPQGWAGALGSPGVNGIQNMPMLSSPPVGQTRGIYLDDGTNRADGRPGFRLAQNGIFIDL